jgi:glycosyltransferase involved in cell wall biosynthesis
MRVLLLANHCRPGPGGAEAVLLATEALLRGRGHELVPFAAREPDTVPTPWAMWFPSVAGAGARTEAGRRLAATASRPARYALHRLLDAAPADVAHVHHVFEGLSLSVVDVLLARRVPVVMTLYDYKPVCPTTASTRRAALPALPGRCYWNVVRHGCLRGRPGGAWPRRSMPTVAVWGASGSGWACSWRPAAISVTGWWPAACRPTGSASWPIPSSFRPTRRGRPGRARPASLYTGRLVAEKGLDDLLSAAGWLRGLATVEVFGKGRLAEALRSRVAREGLLVRLHGFAGRERLAGELGPPPPPCCRPAGRRTARWPSWKRPPGRCLPSPPTPVGSPS